MTSDQVRAVFDGLARALGEPVVFDYRMERIERLCGKAEALFMTRQKAGEKATERPMHG